MTIRILVADDHAPFRLCLASLLEQQPGFEVVGTLGGGHEAIEALSRTEPAATLPDVLILDLEMRDLDGLCTARRLIARHPGLRILILSWHDDLPFVDAAFEAGCRGYLLKDDPLTELVMAVREIAAGQAHVSRALIGDFTHQTSGPAMSAFC